MVMFTIMKKNIEKGDNAYKKSINYVTDTSLNIKTVLSLGHEK